MADDAPIWKMAMIFSAIFLSKYKLSYWVIYRRLVDVLGSHSGRLEWSCKPPRKPRGFESHPQLGTKEEAFSWRCCFN